MAVRNDPETTRTVQGPAEDQERRPEAEEDLEEAAELLPQQEPSDPEDPLPPGELDPLLTDPAD